MKKTYSRALLTLAVAIAGHSQAADRCYKVDAYYTGTGTPPTDRIRPEEGIAAGWSGACDTCNGSLNLPPTINVNGWGTTIPYLSLLAASSAVPFTTYGQRAGFPSEYVFARCHPNVPIYEAYSTNGDNSLGGLVGADTYGIPDAYPTAWQKIAIRIRHDLTGEYFTSTWKQRLLNPTPDSLDKDSTGYNLVKAKNLTPISVELFLIDKTSGGWWGSGHRRYTYTQPNGYIALQAPGLSQIRIGESHSGGNWSGWHGYWPGAIGLYLNTETRFAPTCVITSNTPYINFQNISATNLNAGQSLSETITVTTECDAGSISGVNADQTSIGILVNPLSVAKSTALGLTNSSGGITHLISIDYDNSEIAKGVGVRILRGTTALNLLSDSEAPLSNAADMGWYSVLPTSGNISSFTRTTQTFTARFEKLPGTAFTATPGAFTATAEIVVKLQ